VLGHGAWSRARIQDYVARTAPALMGSGVAD